MFSRVSASGSGSSSTSSSDDSEAEAQKKKSKKKKKKQKKKKRKQQKDEAEGEEAKSAAAATGADIDVYVPSVRAEEIPDVPPNKFLFRGDPVDKDKDKSSATLETAEKKCVQLIFVVFLIESCFCFCSIIVKFETRLSFW